jgi:hypothetical protein
MRTAREFERVVSVSGEGLETPQLRLDEDTIRANAAATEEFIQRLADAGIRPESSEWGNTIWREVPKSHIAFMLRRFVSHPLDFVFQQDFLAKFLEDTDEACLDQWDVALPNGSENETEFAGVRYRPQKRRVTVNNSIKSILVSGSSRRVGSRGIEREGMGLEEVRRIEDEYRLQHGKKMIPDRAFRNQRQRPLMLLHLTAPELDDKPLETYGKPLVALGLSFPHFDDSKVAKRVAYKI